MKSSIHIGGASGYWGESAMATPQLLEYKKLDYLVYDYLAEITMSIMAQAKAKDASRGFATDFIDHVLKPNLEEIAKQGFQNNGFFDRTISNYDNSDSNTVQLLYFNYKTYMNEVYKVKETATGASKIIVRDDQFDPPIDELEAKYGKMSRSLEVLYEGVLVLGTNKLLKWEMAKNMMRPKSDYTKVKMNYSIVAPRMYKGRIESLVGRITGFADMIQLTHLK